MGDGEQRDARVLGGLEDLSLHVDAHRAGTLIQQRIFGPDRKKEVSLKVKVKASRTTSGQTNALDKNKRLKYGILTMSSMF